MMKYLHFLHDILEINLARVVSSYLQMRFDALQSLPLKEMSTRVSLRHIADYHSGDMEEVDGIMDESWIGRIGFHYWWSVNESSHRFVVTFVHDSGKIFQVAYLDKYKASLNENLLLVIPVTGTKTSNVMILPDHFPNLQDQINLSVPLFYPVPYAGEAPVTVKVVDSLDIFDFNCGGAPFNNLHILNKEQFQEFEKASV